MTDPGSSTPPERDSTTGPWPGVEPSLGPGGGSEADPPTVIRGSKDAKQSLDPSNSVPVVNNTAPSGSSRKGRPGTGSSLRQPAPDHPALPRPGDTVGIFELQESIGVGGMGAVFRARDSQLDRTVALKLLPPDFARDPEAVQRFYQEGRAAARLDHENVARVFSIGHDGYVHYIAFEYVDGTTIRQKVEREGVLSVGESIEVTLQVAAALVHASERGVVHRDVKPSNIILTADGRAKLVDMGLARRFERGDDTGLTQTGMYLGTFDYISPEQGRDPRDVDVRSDLYSLGCTIFFMLTGRPPYPDGNVLQKLLRHREEPAPDLRAFNANVPAELAAIVMKLMAKDRDRRYQTPEQLARDLLSLSASLGLRSNVTGIPSWTIPKPPPAWERHLIWAVPALAFAILITALLLAGPPFGSEPPPSLTSLGPDSPPRVKASPTVTSAPVVREIGTEPPRPAVSPALPREIIVNSDDDLLKVIAEAPPRSTILLANDGPYTLRASGRSEATRLVGIDLTLKADVGSNPVVRLARGPGGSDDRSSIAALLDLKGGRLVVDGIQFVVEATDRSDPPAAIQAEDAELTITHCLFRRTAMGAEGSAGKVVALRVRSSNRAGVDQKKSAGSTIVDACHFDVGMTACVLEGPAELGLRETTIGPNVAGASFELRNPSGLEPASLHLRHVSIMAGSGPVFLCSGMQPRIRVEQSVVAPSADTKTILVESDEPNKLDWQGWDNLYARVAVFLQPKRTLGAGRAGIADFDLWADDPASPREFGSALVSTTVWDDKDPARLFASDQDDPSSLFRLGEVKASQAKLGARQGPFGAIAPPSKILVESAPKPREALQKGDRTPSSNIASPTPANPALPFGMIGQIPDLTTRPMPKSDVVSKPSDERPIANGANDADLGVDELPEMPVMPPMSVKPDVGGEISAPTTPIQGPRVDQKPTASSTTRPTASGTKPNPVGGGPEPKALGAGEPNLARSAAQFAELLRKASNRGETVRVAADADWDLPASVLTGTGAWTIRAEAGTRRPRLRFRPPAPELTDQKSAKGSISPGWLTILAGSLRLEGLDIIVSADLGDQNLPIAAIVLGAAGDLSLTDCTVTLEGNRSRSAAVRVVATEGRPLDPNGEMSVATIRVKNCLLRSGGDLFDVEPSQPVDIEVDNAVVATQGSVLRGHGVRAGAEAQTLKLTLRQVSTRAAGGVVQLNSTAEQPDLPYAEVVVRNSVLATNPMGDPLILLEGQDDVEAMRGRVQWDGHNVAYHKINTYRRDQVRKVGTPPILFDRASWEVAVGRREASPIHDDLKFTRDWVDDQALWTLKPDDLELRPDSPANLSGSGSDLSHIPRAPLSS